MSYIDPNKIHIRLPTDHGPNPYDSRTQPRDLPKNEWLVSWGWWFTIIALGAGFTLTRYFNGTL